MKIKTEIKWFVRVVVGLLLLAVVFYLALLAVNLKDEAPGPEAARLEAMFRARPKVPAAENGYAYLLDWGNAQNSDPQRKNREGWAYVTLNKTCTVVDRACLTLLEQSPKQIATALEDIWMREHYQQLIAHGKWQAPMPFDASADVRYTTALDGQRLLMLEGWTRARAGDAAAVKKLLADDHRFWRMVAGTTEDLISKMIASAAFRRNLEFGNLVLSQLPRKLQAQATPAQWHEPLTVAERSLLLPMVGEYKYFQSSLEGIGAGTVSEELGLPDAAWTPVSPLLKPQATMNGWAKRTAQLISLVDVEADQYPAALARMQAAEKNRTAWSVSYLYNPVGKILNGASAPIWSTYSALMGDTEGVRRAVLLASELRIANPDSGQIARRIADSPLRNPHTGGAFGWHAGSRSVVFNGLQREERGRHSVPL